jgi:hypothetical protein
VELLGFEVELVRVYLDDPVATGSLVERLYIGN